MEVKKSTKPALIELSELKTYRPVQFNKQQESFFKHGNPKFQGLHMTFDPATRLIEVVVPDKDAVVLVEANIEYMKRA